MLRGIEVILLMESLAHAYCADDLTPILRKMGKIPNKGLYEL